MNQFGLVDVAEDRLDLRRRPAQDALRLRNAVVDESARDFAAVGITAAAGRAPRRARAAGCVLRRPVVVAEPARGASARGAKAAAGPRAPLELAFATHDA